VPRDAFGGDDFGGDDRAFGVQHGRVFLFGEVPGLNVLSIGLGDRDALHPDDLVRQRERSAAAAR
jgi:hypothetical protein